MYEVPEPFVEGWDFVQTLGEGAYGEVKLLVNRVSQDAVATKIIDYRKLKDDGTCVKKEICIHSQVNHANIVKYYGHRKVDPRHYIFLEYITGGELFDRIEPDVGMELVDAQRYFKSIISAVEYLHRKGIVHRDIKPENMLLDDKDVLKISDFGLATLFRHQGEERILSTFCGTIPYLAPEVVARKQYRAQPVDVWSCGIVLVALLSGELPWNKPAFECVEYQNWKDCDITVPPWSKIDNLALSLLRKILVDDPKKRMEIQGIKAHSWFNKNFSSGSTSEGTSVNPPVQGQNKRMCLDEDRVALSQPTFGNDFPEEFSESDAKFGISFSQPLNLDNLLVGSQLQSTPCTSQSIIPRLVKRMTRFFVSTSIEDTLKHLTSAMEMLNYTVKKSSPRQLTATVVDKYKSLLVFKAFVITMAGNTLVDFRLSNGDGLEFKRCFLKIKSNLSSIINTKVQIQASAWAKVLPTNSRLHDKDSDGASGAIGGATDVSGDASGPSGESQIVADQKSDQQDGEKEETRSLLRKSNTTMF